MFTQYQFYIYIYIYNIYIYILAQHATSFPAESFTVDL